MTVSSIRRAVPSPARTAPSTARAGVLLAIACICQLMVVLDVSVVNIALPSIRADLGFQPAHLQWVVNAYALTFGGLLLLGGRIADLFGLRRSALIGLGMFALTSLLGGLAQSPGELIAARTLQGVAGALLLPVSLTMITVNFAEGPARHRALTAWSAVGSAGGAVGLILGGFLTQEIDWRWVLFINVPVAAVALVLAAREIAPRPSGPRPRLDLPGAALVTVGLFSLIYAVVGTDQHSWGSAQTLAPLALSAAALGAFGYFEQRVAAAPLVRFGLLRSRPLLGANLVMFLVGSVQFGAFYLASLYLQGTFGYSALGTGIAFVPFTLGVISGSMLAGRIVPRTGPRPTLLVGLLLGAVGIAWFAGLSQGGTFLTEVLGPSLVTSVGIGLSFVSLATAATSGVARHEAGLASGLLNSSRQCGGSIGLAVLVTVADAAGNPTTGTDRAFLVAAGLMAAGAAIAALLVRAPRATGEPGLVGEGRA
jgi:EmrB/QacA subfamily drug resistance transporter